MSNQYGFARMPRIIRKGYKQLTKLQKLLYIYLRDLCGENGECYRSLRTLAEETDFSVGYLSENIPLLAEVGLINAQKRKHNNKKWEVWHITIVDIWEENSKFIQSEKRSPDEQITDDQDTECSPDEQIDPKSVRDVNENSQKCSRGANKEEKSLNKNQLHTEKEVDTSSSSSAIILTQEERAFHELYFSSGLATQSKKIDAKRKEDYSKLAKYVKTLEQLKSLHTFTEMRIYGDNKTVYIGNLANAVEAWAREQEKGEEDQGWFTPNVSPLEQLARVRAERR